MTERPGDSGLQPCTEYDWFVDLIFMAKDTGLTVQDIWHAIRDLDAERVSDINAALWATVKIADLMAIQEGEKSEH